MESELGSVLRPGHSLFIAAQSHLSDDARSITLPTHLFSVIVRFFGPDKPSLDAVEIDGADAKKARLTTDVASVHILLGERTDTCTLRLKPPTGCANNILVSGFGAAIQGMDCFLRNPPRPPIYRDDGLSDQDLEKIRRMIAIGAPGTPQLISYALRHAQPDQRAKIAADLIGMLADGSGRDFSAAALTLLLAMRS